MRQKKYAIEKRIYTVFRTLFLRYYRAFVLYSYVRAVSMKLIQLKLQFYLLLIKRPYCIRVKTSARGQLFYANLYCESM
jgi:hypothetical protein